MPSYSVATTKDNLSRLIDKALAGEEVIITRHGKPVVELNVVTRAAATPSDRAAALDSLRTLRASLPPVDVPYLELKRLEEAEGAR